MTTPDDDKPVVDGPLAEDRAADAPVQAAAATAARDDEDTVETAEIISDEPEDTRTAQQIAIDETKEIGGVILGALALVLVLRTLLFQPFTIPSASMEPNLYQGDYIIVSKWNYGISKYSFPVALPFMKGRLFDTMPKRGDVVVFKLPADPSKDYIKRVVGLPGDRLQMKNDQLYINDVAVPAKVLGQVDAPDARYITGNNTATLLEESLPGGKVHKMQDMYADGSVDNTDVYLVPEGHYFMMGDNRDNSEDSRFPKETGGVDYVPAENLEGKANFILMSWKEGSSLWKPWTWLNFKWDRFFKGLQ